MRYAIRLLAALPCLLFVCNADASISAPRFQPAAPVAGESVAMVVDTDPCTYLLDASDEVDVSVQAGRIDVVIDAIHSEVSGGCAGDFGSYTFRLGKFAPGTYEVHISLRDAAPPTVYSSLRVAPLTIYPLRSHTIPTIGPVGIVLLVAAVFLASRRTGSMTFALVLTCASGPGRAEEPGEFAVAVLLADGPTKPADLVEDYRFSGDTEPRIAGLGVGNPIRSIYLTWPRARGDYADWLLQHPDSELALLENYVVVIYGSLQDAQAGLAALQADPEVEHAHAMPEYTLSAGNAVAKAVPYWPAAVGAGTATTPRGWALIGEVDSGIATNHPLLREFGGAGSLNGGAFRAALSFDFGRNGMSEFDYNVDEMQPEKVFPADAACDTDGDGYVVTSRAGHGTHVAGLLAGAGPANEGTCPGCSLAVTRVAYLRCDTSGNMVPKINITSFGPALGHLASVGAQVINQSYGQGNYLEDDYCPGHSKDTTCLQISALTKRDIAMVAASGNSRTRIDFPARDPRVIAVGGVDTNLEFWDEDVTGPDFVDGCPKAGDPAECGSNYTLQPLERKQDFVAPARAVESTVYPGMDWNTRIRCGDGFGGPVGDGIGLCTGTSMATPMVSGAMAAVRSANPLLAVKDVKTLLASASIRPDGGAGWDARLGYGIPQRDATVRLALGRVGKRPLRNRMTPLFTLHSAGALDRAAVASPQVAMALLLGPPAAWVTTGLPIAGYPAFAATFPQTPRAEAFVFTTEHSPYAGRPLVPLRLLRRPRAWPAGCELIDPNCSGDHVDFVLSTDDAEVPALVGNGFEHIGVQGYIYARCTPEPECIPLAAVELIRRCNTAIDDCAVFPRDQETDYTALGYTAALGAHTVLGYAYPNTDQDGDTLIDGFETWAGLNPQAADSDKDGVADGVELPLAGVAVSDPCPRGICDASFVFADGYE